MFSFAREVTKKAPANSLIPLVLAHAHWEMFYRSNYKASYFKNPNVWYEMKDVYMTLCKRFPDSNRIHNWFAAAAYLADDYETARSEFKTMGENWFQEAWGDRKYFEKVRKEVLGN